MGGAAAADFSIRNGFASEGSSVGSEAVEEAGCDEADAGAAAWEFGEAGAGEPDLVKFLSEMALEPDAAGLCAALAVFDAPAAGVCAAAGTPTANNANAAEKSTLRQSGRR